MHQPKLHKIGILGYVYITLGALGILYYLSTYTITYNTLATYKQLQALHCRSMILLVSIAELLLGIYIKSCMHRYFLFVQALATMLMITAQGLVIYAYFMVDAASLLSSGNAIHIAEALLIVCVLLHLSSILEHKYTKHNLTTSAPKYNLPFDIDDY